jgi:hypothetical protein
VSEVLENTSCDPPMFVTEHRNRRTAREIYAGGRPIRVPSDGEIFTGAMDYPYIQPETPHML